MCINALALLCAARWCHSSKGELWLLLLMMVNGRKNQQKKLLFMNVSTYNLLLQYIHFYLHLADGWLHNNYWRPKAKQFGWEEWSGLGWSDAINMSESELLQLVSLRMKICNKFIKMQYESSVYVVVIVIFIFFPSSASSDSSSLFHQHLMVT